MPQESEDGTGGQNKQDPDWQAPPSGSDAERDESGSARDRKEVPPALPTGSPLREFCVSMPRLGAVACAKPQQELPPSLRHALQFLRALPALPSSERAASNGRSFLPPQRDARPTLVLDLDETLVHCSRGAQTPDVMVQVDDSPTFGGVVFRPFVNFFLKAAAKHFEIVIFTASQKAYADKVINALDPLGTFVSHRLYRQHCTEHRGAFFKELCLLGRPVSQCVLVDNSPISVACNADQGVLVRSWYGDRDDKELMELLALLQDLLGKSSGDMGRYLARRYGLREFFQGLRADAATSAGGAAGGGRA